MIGDYRIRDAASNVCDSHSQDSMDQQTLEIRCSALYLADFLKNVSWLISGTFLAKFKLAIMPRRDQCCGTQELY
jgi:hypothetical protein